MTSTDSGRTMKSKLRHRVHFMAHDWPDDLHMSEETFEKYAMKLERDDFEDDIRCLSSSLHQLIYAREDTITKLRRSADYLDSVWIRCKISRSLGTSASVVGGSLTIAGGVLTVTTAGLGAPLLIAGIATSSVGAATNIGTSLIEKVINSKQVREMSSAMTIDKDLTLKIESQIDDLRRYKDSVHLGALLVIVEKMLGPQHLLVAILRSIFAYDVSGIIDMSARFFSQGIQDTLVSMSEVKTIAQGVITSASATAGTATATAAGLAAGCLAAASTSALVPVGSAGLVAAGNTASEVAKQSAKNAAQTGLRYNPIGADVFIETGKVVGSNSTRLAGNVIVGVSAAFLVWDAIDLGINIVDLIRKKGSSAAKILRDKANELEEALNDTKSQYSVEMIRD